MTDTLSVPAFDNRFVRALPGYPDPSNQRRQVEGALYSRVLPTPVARPRLLAHSPQVAALLGFSEEVVATPEFAQVFGGNALLPGMQPYASNYGGHQFGHWAGQLGDGRAITLGECIGVDGASYEVQLKGAGPTPYSRGADGRAVLRSSIREFLCSEAMHALGVPTTRALSLVSTGEDVLRDLFYDGHPALEPGAVVCRIAPSFLRFGHFELPAARGDHALLAQLVDFTIEQHFPGLTRDAWFAQICERTAVLMAHWMRVGFVHGVMNTDNLSILGLTIDYGPYGWTDDFNLEWTPNTTDAAHGRYRFGYQPRIAYWNLGKLAAALAPLWPSTDGLQTGLAHYAATYATRHRLDMAAKLGLQMFNDDDTLLLQELHRLLQTSEIDMTLFFRALADLDLQRPALTTFADAFYDVDKVAAQQHAWQDWLQRYAARVLADGANPVERRARMHAVNPRYVLRNYLAQQAIERAEAGDPSEVVRLLEVLQRPYDDQPQHAVYAQRRPDWARDRPGCSALSCSS